MIRTITTILFLFCASLTQASAEYTGPKIDVHLHAMDANWPKGYAPPNPATGKRSLATSGAELAPETLKQLKKHNFVKAIISGPINNLLSFKKLSPNVLQASLMFPFTSFQNPTPNWPDIKIVEELIKNKKIMALGELTLQYIGMGPNSPKVTPYLALAEKHGIPVSIHVGLTQPGASLTCCKDYRVKLSDPTLLEPVLLAFPKLKVNVMHAGYPMKDKMLALMIAYPNVYVDLGVIDWVIPEAAFYEYLKTFINLGFENRIMYGSDQMVWPEAISMSVDRINKAPFLTRKQKELIFYKNALKFFNL